MSHRICEYVRRDERAAFEALGWTFKLDLGLPDGFDSVLMEWDGATPPAYPVQGPAQEGGEGA
ncbi:hypothetical protein [Methylocystis sp. SC2]|uniref:hypothetical protein n=1 Tax=Methylocystis sp. (strain SC2) TaxID=187303 RepID=UPI00027AF0F6|nr:hypothetical protein [Methylocystis sp. SC2]CCJ07109.1 Hypothetical protein BN69_1658 [Methylocystis sp. SC2]